MAYASTGDGLARFAEMRSLSVSSHQTYPGAVSKRCGEVLSNRNQAIVLWLSTHPNRDGLALPRDITSRATARENSLLLVAAFISQRTGETHLSVTSHRWKNYRPVPLCWEEAVGRDTVSAISQACQFCSYRLVEYNEYLCPSTHCGPVI